MTITNGYATLQELKTDLGIRDVADDPRLEIAISAASRQIDRHCGQRFWQDGSVVAREFYADDAKCVRVPEGISSTTGLIVKIDEDDDGTFETTLTIATHFILLPVNAADNVPAEPFTAILAVGPTTSLPRSASGRPGVQVTAKFGWADVPDEVNKATLIQAAQLFKASDAVFGGLQLGLDGGVLRVRQALNPMAAALLEPFVRAE